MTLQSIDIFGFKGGVQKNKKPFLIMDDAFLKLEGVYCWREEIRKREGMQYLGRFRRSFEAKTLLVTSDAGTWHIDTIYTQYDPPVTAEATAEIQPGSVIIIIGGAITFTDQGNGLLTSATPGNSGYINYLTGDVYLTHTAGAGVATTAQFAYYPGLPSMGIPVREIAGVNDEQTMWFDTKYCYVHDGSNFSEFLPASGTTWNGDDSDFFWATNYRGSDAQTRLFFVTNFGLSGGLPDPLSPMRYTDSPVSATWTDFEPAVSSTQFLFAARILIPYYGRLLAFNCWEGVDRGTSVNIYNRCRFSQIGSPIAADSWRSDQFGKGGFIDAPINEEIVSARFYKNTLIVYFERSTWRLQYLGEYGLPFIWERISSDFGSESTFSTVLFDNGVLAVGDKAIVGSSGSDVQRIDLAIPDQVFSFLNDDDGLKRVHGIRDFKKELVFWCFPDFDSLGNGQYFPNKTLVYNYRNNTFAFFRNNVTCFGNFQYFDGISWDRTDIYWYQEDVYWDDVEQSNFPLIVSGNQQGFAHYYNYPNVDSTVEAKIIANDQESLSITGVTVGADNTQLTIKDHNLVSGEIIYVAGLNFVVTATPEAGSTDLNNRIYSIQYVDIDTIRIFVWSPDDNAWVDIVATNVGDYVGGGVVALFPNILIETKDFNPVKDALGMNIKTSYIDFLFDVTDPSPIQVLMQMNAVGFDIGNSSGNQTQGNLLIGNKSVESAQTKTGFITNITQTASPTVVITSKNHGLLTGDMVTFGDVGGSTELNGNSYTVTFLTTNTFTVSEAGISSYTFGGYWEQIGANIFFTLQSQYAWHRFFSTCFGQYLRLVLTYSDEQMAQISTNRQLFALNAMKIWYRPGGRNIFGK